MRGKRTIIRQDGPHRTIRMTPRPGQSEESIQHDLHSFDSHAKRLLEDGTQSYKQFFRWIGPIKFMCYKEVGPPPWKYPRIKIEGTLRKPFVMVLIGWRSTAFMGATMWQRKPK